MIKRQLESEFKQLLTEYPVVVLLGPRQAGKTTLARQSLPKFEYSNLENPEVRAFASDDPKAFLAQFKGNVILDEIQRVPTLLSYIQAGVDERRQNGQYVLTGSHQMELHQAISQSLAGRVGILQLLPFSIAELAAGKIQFDKPEDYIYQGFLPRIYDQKQRPTTAYSNYFQTYVERDVRQIIHLKELAVFEKFIKLLAGRVGQLMDHVSLAGDVGVSAKTIKHWLSILEASFVVYQLKPYYENLGKRMVKSPKYYFTDVGLLSYLLGIESAAQVARDPLVGQLFENLVVIECLKSQLNQGKMPSLYFYRDSNGNEVDILYQRGRELIPIEIKSSSTYRKELLKGLQKMVELAVDVKHGNAKQGYLVYAGDEMQFSANLKAIRYNQVAEIFL